MARRRIAGLSALAAVGVLAGAVATPALAQEVAADAVARCRALTDDAARIECLEQALLAEPPAAAAPAAAAPQPDAEPPQSNRRGLRLPGIPFVGGSEGRQVDPIVTSDSPDAEAFGAQNVANRQRAEDDPNAPEEVVPRLVASVVSAREVGYKQLQVELDNGQVWRQIGSDQPWNFGRYGEPENVEIWPTRLGGYRLLDTEQNVVIRVERVE